MVGHVDFVVGDDGARRAEALRAHERAGRRGLGGGVGQERAVDGDGRIHDEVRLAVDVGNHGGCRVFRGEARTVCQGGVVVGILAFAIGVAGTELGRIITHDGGDVRFEYPDVPDIAGRLRDVVEHDVEQLRHALRGEGVHTGLRVDHAAGAEVVGGDKTLELQTRAVVERGMANVIAPAEKGGNATSERFGTTVKQVHFLLLREEQFLFV